MSTPQTSTCFGQGRPPHNHIMWAEVKFTNSAKCTKTNPKRAYIYGQHALAKTTNTQMPTITQWNKNFGYALSSTIKQAIQWLQATKHVTINTATNICYFNAEDTPACDMYDSGADRHYISNNNWCCAHLPILRQSTKWVGIANWSTSRGKHVTTLPFPGLSKKAKQADTFLIFLCHSWLLARLPTSTAYSFLWSLVWRCTMKVMC